MQKPSDTTQKDTDVKVVHIVTGSPWRDAIISILEPYSCYRPFSGAENAQPGDAVVAVLDTEPPSVVAGAPIVADDRDIHSAITRDDGFRRSGLVDLVTLNAVSDFSIQPREATVHGSQSPQNVVDRLRDIYTLPRVDGLSGHNSLTAARVLLESEGRCTACRSELELASYDARDRVHILTIDSPIGEPTSDGRASSSGDWPAVLCDSCHARMREGGFANFVEFRFSLNPRCPRCGARHTKSAAYGMASSRALRPWIARMGCVVRQPARDWVCADCDHRW